MSPLRPTKCTPLPKRKLGTVCQKCVQFWLEVCCDITVGSFYIRWLTVPAFCQQLAAKDPLLKLLSTREGLCPFLSYLAFGSLPVVVFNELDDNVVCQPLCALRSTDGLVSFCQATEACPVSASLGELRGLCPRSAERSSGWP